MGEASIALNMVGVREHEDCEGREPVCATKA